MLVDFDTKPTTELLKKAHRSGIHFIKFHSYVQKIDNSMYEKCIEWARMAEESGIGICIDTSYGSHLMYKYDNLTLAADICSIIKDVPIILLHSGGLRVLEAMLLCDVTENLYLECSLSPHYYSKIPSVTNDIISVYSRLGHERILYASDYPYLDFSDSADFMDSFFISCGFTEEERHSIFFDNSVNLLSSL